MANLRHFIKKASFVIYMNFNILIGKNPLLHGVGVEGEYRDYAKVNSMN
jgi:hypothetical protein